MGTDCNKRFGREHPPALSQVTLLECIWTDCPIEVRDEARYIWEEYDYGNDYYYHNWCWEEDITEYPIIYKYLIEHKIEPNTKILIHFWW